GELAQILADFHSHADTSPEISRYGSQESIGANLDENFGQIEKYIGIAIPNGKFQHIKDYSYRFAEKRSGLFKRRTKSGRIRDCHGDVHSAQVCFTPDGVRIIDCIEFTERFRYCDVASEIAFMAMDLDFHNRHDLSLAFVDAYVSASSDEEIRELLDFYKVYLACVRGKVESFRLDDPHLSGNDRVVAQERARRYFDLAYAYSLKGQKSAILAITSGLVGAGKTTVAQAIGAEAGFVVISSDVVRKRLAGIPPTSHRYEDFDSGIYTQEFSERTYNEMFRLAGRLLQEGYSVVMDATFRHPEDRIKAVALSEEAGAQFWAVECVCDEAVVRERLERRVEEDASVSDGRWEIYLWEKEIAVPLSDVPQGRHLVVDTSRLSLVEAVVTVLEAMELRVPADGASR
ncbi:MAG: hypothetical protein HW403_503, partial [Dehalococcoidia bacterium]|nr:hypothetical protein [Dehalococcoidia bacterium]